MTNLLQAKALNAYQEAQNMQTEYSRFIDLEKEFYRVQEECWFYDNINREDHEGSLEEKNFIPEKTRQRFETLAFAYLSHPLLLQRFERLHEGETDEETLRLHELLEDLQRKQSHQ